MAKAKSPKTVKTIVVSLLVGVAVTFGVLMMISSKNQKLVDTQQEMIKVANQIDQLGAELGEAPTQEETRKIAEQMVEKSNQILVLNQALVDGSSGRPKEISMKKQEIFELQNQRIKKLVEFTSLENPNGPEGKQIIKDLAAIKAETAIKNKELQDMMAAE